MTAGFAFLEFVTKAAVFAVLPFALYALLLKRLAQAVQPLRLRMAEEGEAALASGELSQEDETDVRLFLANAYNGWVAVFVLMVMPIAATMLLFQRDKDAEAPPSPVVARLLWRFAVSGFAANPVCGLLVAGEFLVIMAILVIATGSVAAVRGIVRKLLRAGPGHDWHLVHRAH